MVDEFGADIRKAWLDFNLLAIVAVDYTEFVKVRRHLDTTPARSPAGL